MNKEQLEAMSDLDINIKVANATYRNLGGRDYTQYLSRHHSQEQGCEVISYCGSELDYCNSPSDMMPLVFEAGITVGTYDDEHFAFSGFEGGVYEECWSNMIYNDNPLRAAAIVYLLMQGDI
jgi:hypothetical protein